MGQASRGAIISDCRRQRGVIAKGVGAALAISLLATGCGLFDTEYEPVQKGQLVEADAGNVAKADGSGGNVPLPTARPGHTSPASPSGVSGSSAAQGSPPSGAGAASGPRGSIRDGGDSGGATGATGSDGQPSTSPSTAVTTIPDPVIATVPHTTPVVPDPIPGSTTSTIPATRDFQAFCEASSGLIRLSHVFLDDGVNVDLAYMSAQAKAAGQYILNMADTYPLSDRSAFDQLIPAANQFIDAFAGFTSVDQVRYAISQFKIAHSAALDQVTAQQAKYCPETQNT